MIRSQDQNLGLTGVTVQLLSAQLKNLSTCASQERKAAVEDMLLPPTVKEGH